MGRRSNRTQAAAAEATTFEEADHRAQARLDRLTARSRLETDSYPEPAAEPAPAIGVRKLFWAPDELAG